MIHAIRLRVMTDEEVERAKEDGRQCLIVDAPGHPDEFFKRWAELEIVNDLGEWHRVHLEL